MLRRLVSGLSLLALAGVSGCVHAPDVARASMSWSYFSDGQESKLAYGVPNSDAVGLMMTCRPHTKLVSVSGEDPSRGPLILVSNGERTRLDGQAKPDPLTGSDWIEAQTAADQGALAHFGRSGELRVVANGRVTSLSASDRDRPQVQRFFSDCD
jgi:hypothetical protein